MPRRATCPDPPVEPACHLYSCTCRYIPWAAISTARSFPINNFDPIASLRVNDDDNDDEDLRKSQPVLSAGARARASTAPQSYAREQLHETFRNNSAPRARSCVPRPESFLSFRARSKRFRCCAMLNNRETSVKTILDSEISSRFLLCIQICLCEDTKRRSRDTRTYMVYLSQS